MTQHPGDNWHCALQTVLSNSFFVWTRGHIQERSEPNTLPEQLSLKSLIYCLYFSFVIMSIDHLLSSIASIPFWLEYEKIGSVLPAKIENIGPVVKEKGRVFTPVRNSSGGIPVRSIGNQNQRTRDEKTPR
jgi:hypothetical protein